MNFQRVFRNCTEILHVHRNQIEPILFVRKTENKAVAKGVAMGKKLNSQCIYPNLSIDITNSTK
jgi:hypothetical protein